MPHAESSAAAIAAGLRILIVDDEKNIRSTLTVCLEGLGAQATAVGTGEAALGAVGRQPYDLAFVDLALGSESGLDLLPKLLGEEANLAVVLITAYGTIETAVEAMRRGAWDYLPKPFTPAQIRHLLEKFKTQRHLTARVAELERRLAEEVPDVEIASRSAAMHAVLDTAARVAVTDAPVLVTGENGTGKSILARAIHRQSPRAAAPFVVTNCPTLSEELLASELFGHAKGAFTGAIRDQAGRVEVAEGGTLFLDEIGEIPPALQSKLLRFLQEKDFERVGETRTRHGDVRIIAATNRDLEADVKAGRFREDLYYRLNVVEVRMPPLRERREDILPLARAFLSTFTRATRPMAPEISPAAALALEQHDWPGNVRELRNTIERIAILWPTSVVEPEALPTRVPRAAQRRPAVGGDFTVDEVEREHILAVLERVPKVEEAAALLGIDASTLWRKRKKYEGT
ncbi:MAG TPA: sigma-54 dependent transcriptional regulator [Polyangia bacterium]|nr:sigma-54 dependent transcriptional regulator [Polyangia bacterium]